MSSIPASPTATAAKTSAPTTKSAVPDLRPAAPYNPYIPFAIITTEDLCEALARCPDIAARVVEFWKGEARELGKLEGIVERIRAVFTMVGPCPITGAKDLTPSYRADRIHPLLKEIVQTDIHNALIQPEAVCRAFVGVMLECYDWFGKDSGESAPFQRAVNLVLDIFANYLGTDPYSQVIRSSDYLDLVRPCLTHTNPNVSCWKGNALHYLSQERFITVLGGLCLRRMRGLGLATARDCIIWRLPWEAGAPSKTWDEQGIHSRDLQHSSNTPFASAKFLGMGKANEDVAKLKKEDHGMMWTT